MQTGYPGAVWSNQFPDVDNAIRILAAAGVIVGRQDAGEHSRLVIMPEYRRRNIQ
jgi:hypothetical protein